MNRHFYWMMLFTAAALTAVLYVSGCAFHVRIGPAPERPRAFFDEPLDCEPRDETQKEEI